jgi:hypothetical protein
MLMAPIVVCQVVGRSNSSGVAHRAGVRVPRVLGRLDGLHEGKSYIPWTLSIVLEVCGAANAAPDIYANPPVRLGVPTAGRLPR